MKDNIAILGCGNIGSAIANGLVKSKMYSAKNIFLSKRDINSLKQFKENGFNTVSNRQAIEKCRVLIIAVTPQQIDNLISEIKSFVDADKHIVLSVVSGVSIKQIKTKFGLNLPVVRVMPNTAIAIQESMTCISADDKDKSTLKIAEDIFNKLGETVIIKEDLMVPATALCACGVAFFLRAVRAASQGGIEIGFHAKDALFMAAQTAKGAASLLLQNNAHPESEVDKVTTPKGVTITGLNQMEHSGFSSALIKGIVTSAEKAENLYSVKE
jgi:pyrroline-5-carboxylate reductase